MRKKKVIKPHEIKPDPKFSSQLVSKLINKTMKNGEKRTATLIVYKAAEIVKKWFEEWQEKQKKEKKTVQGVVETEKEEKKVSSEMEQTITEDKTDKAKQEKELSLKTTSSSFLTVFEKALVNIKPAIEMKSRRIGASKQRIPKEIDDGRSSKIALRWLVEGARDRREEDKGPMFESLAKEIIEAYKKSGNAFKKKENLHKEAESGRVFSR